mmetsp:Transcript_15203/g.40100  ORF Transcript_15203/g.40100 Transcript_15203/m.40100 type:complete len:489 (+) Transcript_15203:115-1581(+)
MARSAVAHLGRLWPSPIKSRDCTVARAHSPRHRPRARCAARLRKLHKSHSRYAPCWRGTSGAPAFVEGGNPAVRCPDQPWQRSSRQALRGRMAPAHGALVGAAAANRAARNSSPHACGRAPTQRASIHRASRGSLLHPLAVGYVRQGATPLEVRDESPIVVDPSAANDGAAAVDLAVGRELRRNQLVIAPVCGHLPRDFEVGVVEDGFALLKLAQDRLGAGADGRTAEHAVIDVPRRLRLDLLGNLANGPRHVEQLQKLLVVVSPHGPPLTDERLRGERRPLAVRPPRLRQAQRLRLLQPLVLLQPRAVPQRRRAQAHPGQRTRADDLRAAWRLRGRAAAAALVVAAAHAPVAVVALVVAASRLVARLHDPVALLHQLLHLVVVAVVAALSPPLAPLGRLPPRRLDGVGEDGELVKRVARWPLQRALAKLHCHLPEAARLHDLVHEVRQEDDDGAPGDERRDEDEDAHCEAVKVRRGFADPGGPDPPG